MPRSSLSGTASVCCLLDVGVFPTIVHALAEEVMSVEVLLGFVVENLPDSHQKLSRFPSTGHTVVQLCRVSASMAQSRWPGPVCHLATEVFPRVCTAGFSLKYCGSAVVCSFWVSQDHRPAHVDLFTQLTSNIFVAQ